ncbi:MAG: beta-lactamase family protein [Acidobacteria bacterium]|nr:beta-lactamase family protein [Acidobacteriota bacterium]
MKSWKQKAVGLIGLGMFLLFALVAGSFIYMAATSTPLHPSAQHVPSVMHVAPPQDWTGAVEQARQIVRASAAGQNLPGVSVAVGVGGEIVWTEGFGWAHLANRVPVTPDMQFRIGTASQALTSAAVGLLLEKGRLKLDDEIQTYVPDFPEKQWPLTLRQLMAHLAGVGNDAGGEEPVHVEDDEKLAVRCPRAVDGLQRFADSPLRFEPGTEYRSSSYGWILVSAAVEAAAEEPFSTFMRKQIFEPLGMNNTAADSPIEPSPDRATFYFPRFSADPRYGPDEGREVDYSCFAGSAAFVSTPADLLRFVMAINSGKLLQPATVQLLQTSQRLPSGQETGYGLGWDTETVALSGEQTRVVGHDGDLMGGMVASLITLPNGIAVAVTSNIGYADTASIALKIAEAFASPARK